MATLRPLGTDDIPAAVDLLAAAEAVDRTGEHYDAGDLAEEYANPDIELGKDIVGAFEGDELVGYFAVYPRDVAGALKCHLDGTVRPSHRGRGVGTALVTAMLARADAVHAEKRPDGPGRFVLGGLTANTAQAEVLAGVGFTPDRWSFGMRAQLADLDLDPSAPSFADGLTLRTYTPELDRATREAHNEAFLDHPDFTPWTEVMWDQWVSGSRNFRPEHSLLVVDDAAPDRVVAYVLSNEFEATFAATGRREAHVSRVGSLREVRGRGVATALLREALRRYREAGFDEASLEVDSENPTGALRIYERAGFEVERRWTVYGIDRAPLTPASPPR